MSFELEQIGPAIIPGATYRYLLDLPAGCQGCRYRVVRWVKDVPSYQQKILVRCLDGPDAGLWFTCTPQNFALRYEMVASEAESGASVTEVSAPTSASASGLEKVADFTSKGKF